MKVAITGAAGHLGSAIVPELIKRNHSVKALVKGDDRSLKMFPVEIIEGDLLNPGTLHTLLKGSDALIHCAALISVNGDPHGMVHTTNVEGTKILMETAKHCGIKRVVHTSSIHAYNQRPTLQLLNENSELVNEKAFAYDRSKKAGQHIALSFNGPAMEVLVVNPTSIIGPYDYKPSKVGKVIIDLYTGRLPFVFDGGFNFCDVRDVANAIVNGLTMGMPGENYLLSGKWHSLRQLAALLAAASGKKIKPFAFPAFVGKAGLPFVKSIAYIKKKEPLYTIEALDAIFAGNKCIISSKAMEQLAYTTRPLQQTLSDAFHWFKNNGYLV